VSAYTEIKAVRRLLRAEAVRPSYEHQDAHVLEKPYETYLRRLNDAQLKLETQFRLVDGSRTQFSDADKLCEQTTSAQTLRPAQKDPLRPSARSESCREFPSGIGRLTLG